MLDHGAYPARRIAINLQFQARGSVSTYSGYLEHNYIYRHGPQSGPYKTPSRLFNARRYNPKQTPAVLHRSSLNSWYQTGEAQGSALLQIAKT